MIVKRNLEHVLFAHIIWYAILSLSVWWTSVQQPLLSFPTGPYHLSWIEKKFLLETFSTNWSLQFVRIPHWLAPLIKNKKNVLFVLHWKTISSPGDQCYHRNYQNIENSIYYGQVVTRLPTKIMIAPRGIHRVLVLFFPRELLDQWANYVYLSRQFLT